VPIDRILLKLVPSNIYGSEQFLKSGAGKETQEIYEGLHSARREAGCVSISGMSPPSNVSCNEMYHLAV